MIRWYGITWYKSWENSEAASDIGRFYRLIAKEQI